MKINQLNTEDKHQNNEEISGDEHIEDIKKNNDHNCINEQIDSNKTETIDKSMDSQHASVFIDWFRSSRYSPSFIYLAM